MPRQKIAAGMRETRLEVRVTKDELRRIDDLAREAGMTRSAWIRRRLHIDREVQK